MIELPRLDEEVKESYENVREDVLYKSDNSRFRCNEFNLANGIGSSWFMYKAASVARNETSIEDFLNQTGAILGPGNSNLRGYYFPIIKLSTEDIFIPKRFWDGKLMGQVSMPMTSLSDIKPSHIEGTLLLTIDKHYINTLDPYYHAIECDEKKACALVLPHWELVQKDWSMNDLRDIEILKRGFDYGSTILDATEYFLAKDMEGIAGDHVKLNESEKQRLHGLATTVTKYYKAIVKNMREEAF